MLPFLSPHLPLTEQMWAGASGVRGQCFGQGPDPAGLGHWSAGLSPLVPRLGGEGGSSSQGDAAHVLLSAMVVWPASGVPDPSLEMP